MALVVEVHESSQLHRLRTQLHPLRPLTEIFMNKPFLNRLNRAAVMTVMIVAVFSLLAIDANAQYGRGGYGGQYGGGFYSSRSGRGFGNSFRYSNSRYRPSYYYGGRGRNSFGRSSFYSPRGFSYGNYNRFRY